MLNLQPTQPDDATCTSCLPRLPRQPTSRSSCPLVPCRLQHWTRPLPVRTTMPNYKLMKHVVCFFISWLALQPSPAHGQGNFKSTPEDFIDFKWVNPIPASRNVPDGVYHSTFRSPSMNVDVGYCIFLPPGYETTKLRYPVIYLLHGGGAGNGNERAYLNIATRVAGYREQGDSIPAIYVFANGGKIFFHNIPELDCMAEDVFVKELIPHIDQTYRAVADRSGRGVEGCSGGGSNTMRIVFEHPNLFSSAIAGCSGFNHEKSIAERGAIGSRKVIIQPGDNAYDRARNYAKTRGPAVSILIAVGTEDRAYYQANLNYMAFLKDLKIPFDKLILEGAGHGHLPMYRFGGRRFVQFHLRNLSKPR